MKVAFWAVVLTFALGLSLAAAYFVVGGNTALIGPYVLRQSWPLIYCLAALFAAAVSVPVGYFIPLGGKLVLVLIAAWFGEYLVLASGVLADELNPLNAVFYWIAATGGPIQPFAAFVGGLVGVRLSQRTSLPG